MKPLIGKSLERNPLLPLFIIIIIRRGRGFGSSCLLRSAHTKLNDFDQIMHFIIRFSIYFFPFNFWMSNLHLGEERRPVSCGLPIRSAQQASRSVFELAPHYCLVQTLYNKVNTEHCDTGTQCGPSRKGTESPSDFSHVRLPNQNTHTKKQIW